jgi:hypothetical protein
MNFNHDTGLIDTLLTIDTSIAPPLGGATNSLVITGNGSLTLPLGADGTRPANAAGQLRYSTTSSLLEFNNGSGWNTLAVGGGAVSSITVTTVSPGLLVSAGTTQTISTSGTFALTLGTELVGLSNLATTGMVSRTGAGTYVGRTIAGTASNITVANGDGVSGAPTIDLATVTQGATGTSFVKVQLDTKGRVINNTPVVAADITTLVDATYVNVAGDSMTSAANLTFSGGGEVLGLPATPTTAGSAASKAYVDSMVQGLDPKASVRAATITAGTLATSFENGDVIDGVTLVTGNRILIKNQAAPEENGIYIVQATGAPVRATDMDSWLEVPGAFVFIEESGSTFADTGWVCTSNAGGTLGSTAITFVQFSGAGTYSAGTGLTLTGTTFSLTSPVAATLGGTGSTATPTNGQLLIGNGTNFTVATLGTGTGISITPGSGTLQINNTGVTSLAGTANQITASASTGAITLSLPSAVTLPGSLTVTTSATISGLTANAFLYSGTAGLLTTTAAPTNGQILIGSTGAAPVLASISAGTGISVTPGAGSISIANTGVTSVALSLPSFITVSGSPVTTTGTLTGTLATQTTNTVFAAPNGSTGTPTFRQLVLADLQATALKLYNENPSTPTAPVASGNNTVALGSGSSATVTDGFAVNTGASSTLYGAKAFANGQFATLGDAQRMMLVARNSTTNATQTELFLDGSSTRLVLPNNSLWTFSILVAGRRTDAVGGGAGYRFDGVIRKDTTAGSTTLVGAVVKSILGETNNAWDTVVDADATNGSLRIRVTGEAAKTIRWVASMEVTQVTN